MIQRWLAWLIGFGIVMVVAAPATSGLLFPSSPAPEPTAIYTPVTPMPKVDTEELVVLPALADAAADVTLSLPKGWQITSLDAMQLGNAFAALQKMHTKKIVDAAQILQAALSEETNIFTATYRPQPTSNLTVMAVKRNGLSLERYLADVYAGLSQHGATIYEVKIDPAWRSDHLPTAVLRYTLPGTTDDDPDAALAGLQIVALNKSAANFVIFTFTTPSEHYEAMRPQFAEILQAAKF